MLQYHADNWDQLIKDDKVNTISLISHAVEHQHNEFEGISYAFWWFSVEHFLCWRGDKERDHKLLVYEVISPKNEHLINLLSLKNFFPHMEITRRSAGSFTDYDIWFFYSSLLKKIFFFVFWISTSYSALYHSLLKCSGFVRCFYCFCLLRLHLFEHKFSKN